MALRNFTAKPTLTSINQAGGITAAATSVTLTTGTDLTNCPAVPFTAVFEKGSLTNEEVVLVTALNTSTGAATITRGYDGTTAAIHANGVSFEHCVTAIDFTEANTHINAGVSAGHGQVQTADIANAAVGQTQVSGGYVDLLQGQTVAGAKMFSNTVTASAGVVVARGSSINMDGGTANTAVLAESTAGTSFTGSAVSDLILKEPNGQRILIGTHGASGVQNPTVIISSTDLQVNDNGTMRSVPRGVIGWLRRTAGNLSTTSTTQVVYTNSSVDGSGTVALVAGRRYKVTLSALGQTSVASVQPITQVMLSTTATAAGAAATGTNICQANWITPAATQYVPVTRSIEFTCAVSGGDITPGNYYILLTGQAPSGASAVLFGASVPAGARVVIEDIGT